MRGVRLALFVLLAACDEADAPIDEVRGDAGRADAQAEDTAAMDAALGDAGELDAASFDGGEPEPEGPRPIVFVHGVNGSSAEFDVMIGRLVGEGWPPEFLYAIDFADPRWGCNVDNADTIAETVGRVMMETGETRVDIVAHSMGTLSSRYYIKNLGGTEVVNTYVTLGGMHHGIRSSCLNPLPVCVWQELCATGEYVEGLNADPSTPGELFWVSIYSTDDSVVPPESAYLEGAENIEVSGVDHAGANGLLEHEIVFPHVLRVLSYPRW
jgi:triacylglycerol lipase